MNIAKNVLTFVLIFAVIAWIFGLINFNQDSYEESTFQEQSEILGAQFNNAVETGTNMIKKIADGAMQSFKWLSSIIDTIGNGINRIAELLGIKPVTTPGSTGGNHDGFQGGGGFGGGGGSSW